MQFKSVFYHCKSASTFVITFLQVARPFLDRKSFFKIKNWLIPAAAVSLLTLDLEFFLFSFYFSIFIIFVFDLSIFQLFHLCILFVSLSLSYFFSISHLLSSILKFCMSFTSVFHFFVSIFHTSTSIFQFIIFSFLSLSHFFPYSSSLSVYLSPYFLSVFLPESCVLHNVFLLSSHDSWWP